MNQEITLNVRYDIPESEWTIVSEVYRSMNGWLGAGDLPRWYGTEDDEQYIWASLEPSGIQFVGKVDAALWTSWLTVLCARLSVGLGRAIHDAEM